ncbi:glycosyltransferase family 4 protein [uncultured Maribacter sp.]|uniref:glycosyltransferase family 4 protein n=1 Tax=uncultured Maribacter sp. TaxID=431308 RepID=UPI00263635E9|nr:glycosyltransferase family 4 protein [uncultured Maribacter sp.]
MKPKILFLLHLPPPVTGATIVGENIKNSKHINLKYEADFINLTTAFSLDSIGQGGLKKISTILKTALVIIKTLSQKKYDLCYMTLTAKGPGFYKDSLNVLLLKFFKIKIVYHFHNKGVKENSNNWLNKFIYRNVFKNTKTILLAKSLYKDIDLFVDKKNVFFCPNGVIPIKNHKKHTSKNKKKNYNLFFLSNMMEEKGVYKLLEACAILSKKNIFYNCHFVGAWSDITKEKFDEKCRNLEISKNVFYHGKKYGVEKQYFYNTADIFVFPTYYHNECFPLVLLEAMQNSLPIISTYEGGIPSIIDHGKTGFLIKQKNVLELANKIEYLLKNPKESKIMGRNGKEKFENLFTLEKFETLITTIFDNIISNPN